MPRWVPNLISAVRIGLIPTFVFVAYQGRQAVEQGADSAGARIVPLAVLLAIGLSDLLDGWIARKYGLESQAGAILDALADKLAQISILAFLALAGGAPFAVLPLWLLAVVVGRDVLLGGGWSLSVLMARPIRVVHRPHGRIASTLVFALLLFATAGASPPLVWGLTMVVVVTVIASTVQYLRDGLERYRRPGL